MNRPVKFGSTRVCDAYTKLKNSELLDLFEAQARRLKPEDLGDLEKYAAIGLLLSELPRELDWARSELVIGLILYIQSKPRKNRWSLLEPAPEKSSDKKTNRVDAKDLVEEQKVAVAKLARGATRQFKKYDWYKKVVLNLNNLLTPVGKSKFQTRRAFAISRLPEQPGLHIVLAQDQLRAANDIISMFRNHVVYASKRIVKELDNGEVFRLIPINAESREVNMRVLDLIADAQEDNIQDVKGVIIVCSGYFDLPSALNIDEAYYKKTFKRLRNLKLPLLLVLPDSIDDCKIAQIVIDAKKSEHEIEFANGKWVCRKSSNFKPTPISHKKKIWKALRGNPPTRKRKQ
jgi:hypothetical protein